MPVLWLVAGFDAVNCFYLGFSQPSVELSVKGACNCKGWPDCLILPSQLRIARL